MYLWKLDCSSSVDEYGATHAMVVAAETENEARLTAGRLQRDGGKSNAFEWMDPNVTTVVSIGEAHPGMNVAMVILTKEAPN
jgi:hypothetical protein